MPGHAGGDCPDFESCWCPCIRPYGRQCSFNVHCGNPETGCHMGCGEGSVRAFGYSTPHGGERVARTIKRTHPPFYLRRCRQITDSGLSFDGDKSGLVSPALTCGVVAELRQKTPNPVASGPVHAEFVQRLRDAHARVDEYLGLQRERRQIGQAERFQVGMPDRCEPDTAGHAPPEDPGEMRSDGIFVVVAAERLPPDMLTGRVPFKGALRVAPGDRATRPPLTVRLAPPVKLLAPVVGGAVDGVGVTPPARHPRKPTLAYGSPEWQYDM